MVNANLEQYKVAGPREVPQIDVTVIENYQGRSATDAYGIAEPPHRDCAGNRKRCLQCNWRATARPADDPGRRAGGARADAVEGLSHAQLRI